MSDVPAQYQRDFDYLKSKSNNGSLTADDHIYKTLKAKSYNLPGLARALDSLNVR
ncbi:MULTISPECIES: hypothetical protein [Rhodococcus]|uniref:hypothetical protein n=1 Tax=Rhodococcus TaxID=1827 RepID=UPI0012E84D0D|nr:MULTISPECIES: hypothetical protein [Rhodococcus]